MTVHLDLNDENELVLPIPKYSLFKPVPFEVDSLHPELYRRDNYPFVTETPNRQRDNESEGGERGDPREVFYFEGDLVGQVSNEPNLHVVSTSGQDPPDPVTPSLGTPEPESPEFELSEADDPNNLVSSSSQPDSNVMEPLNLTISGTANEEKLIEYDPEYFIIPEELQQELDYDLIIRECEASTSTENNNNSSFSRYDDWGVSGSTSYLERFSARRSAALGELEAGPSRPTSAMPGTSQANPLEEGSSRTKPLMLKRKRTGATATGTSRATATVTGTPRTTATVTGMSLAAPAVAGTSTSISPAELYYNMTMLSSSQIGPSTSDLKPPMFSAFFRPYPNPSEDSD